jgi:hypothetical protein
LILGAPCWHSQIVLDEQFPGEVIQRRAKIVDDFPNPKSPHWIGLFLFGNGDCQYLGIAIEINGGLVGTRLGFQEGSDVGLQSLEFIPGTFALQSDSAKNIGLHTGTLDGGCLLDSGSHQM